jgi:hypothetical protein
LRFNVIQEHSGKTTSTPHVCLIYVKCMSNVPLGRAVARALPRAQVAMRASFPRPCPLNGFNKTRICQIRRSSSSLRMFRRFFMAKKTGSHVENMWKHGFYRDLGGIMFLRFAVALAGPAASRRRIPAEPLNLHTFGPKKNFLPIRPEQPDPGRPDPTRFFPSLSLSLKPKFTGPCPSQWCGSLGARSAPFPLPTGSAGPPPVPILPEPAGSQGQGKQFLEKGGKK